MYLKQDANCDGSETGFNRVAFSVCWYHKFGISNYFLQNYFLGLTNREQNV